MDSKKVNALREIIKRERIAARQALNPADKEFVDTYSRETISLEMIDENIRRYKQCSKCGKVYVKLDPAGQKYILSVQTKQGVHHMCASPLEKAAWPQYPYDS